MICPFCKKDKLKVIRTIQYETCVIRVRFCEDCDHPHKTVEQFCTLPPIRVTIQPNSAKLVQS